MTDAAVLPDVTAMVQKYMRAHDALTGVTIDSKVKAPPMLQVRRMGGIPRQHHGNWLDAPRIMVISWALPNDEVGAMTLARTAHGVLHEIDSLVTEQGTMGGVRDTLGFMPSDDPLTDYAVVRFEVSLVAHN